MAARLRWVTLPSFQNVVASGTAVLTRLPQGDTYHAIRLNMGGTFTKAMITGIRVRLGGKVIWDITGSHLDDVNDYVKITANAAYLTLWFSDPVARTIEGEELGALDTSLGYSNFSMEVDISGATSPTLGAQALISPPQEGGAKALFKAMLKATHSIGAAGTFPLQVPFGSDNGNLIRRVHLFGSIITHLEVKRDGEFLQENAPIGDINYSLNELTRTTQSNMIVWDPTFRNNQANAIPTAREDGRPAVIEIKPTTSGSGTIVSYSELYTTIDRI